MPQYATDGPLPRDTVGFPSEGVYVPGVGTVAQQGGTVAMDGNNQSYAPAVVSLVPNQAVQQATSNAAVAAGASTTAQAIKASAGFLSGVLVTSAASAALSIYDNASAASGTVIGYVPSTAAAGTYYPFNMPASAGITAGKVSGSPAITVAYS